MPIFKFKKSQADLSDWGKHDEKLIVAIEHNDLDKINNILTKKGICPTKLDKQGHTAFHLAATQGKLEVINHLLAHKADTNAIDAQGRLALHCASRHGWAQIVERVLQVNNNSYAKDHSELTALHQACLGGHLDCVQMLLRFDAPVDAVDKGGRSPLFIAAQMGHPAICRVLLEAGADINARDAEKKTAVMLAAEHGNRGVCEYLVRKGANVLLADEYGHNAGWYAVNAGHTDIKQIISNAPSRALWDVGGGNEESDASTPVPEQVDYISSFAEDSPSIEEGDLRNLDQLEVGIVPLDEYEDHDTPSPRSPELSVQEVREVLREPQMVVTEEYQVASMQKSEISHLQSAPPASVTEVVALDTYKELEEEHEFLNDELQRVNNENRRLLSKMQRLDEEMRQAHAQQEQMTSMDEGEHTDEEGEDYLGKLEEERERNAELEEELQLLRKQLELDSKPEAERNGENDSWNDSDEDLFSSPDAHKMKMKGASGSDEEAKLVAMLRSQLVNLSSENDQLKSKIEILSSEKAEKEDSDAEKELDSLAQFQELQQAHEIECNKLNLRILQLEDENSKLQELRKACNMFESESRELRKTISDMEEENSKKEETTEKEKKEHEEVRQNLEKKVKELDEANVALVHNLQKAHEQEKDEMKEEMKKIKNKVKQLEEENDIMVGTLKEKGEVEEDWRRMQEKISRLEQENDVLLQDLQKSPSREELEDEIQEMKEKMEQIEEDKKLVEEELEKTKKESENLSQKIDFLGGEINYLKGENADIEKRKEDEMENWEKEKNILEEEMKEMNEMVRGLEEDKEELYDNLQDAQKAASVATQVDEMHRKVSQVEEDNLVLVRSLKQSQDREDAKVIECQRQVEQLQKENDQLQGQLSDVEEEKVQIASERDQLFENISELVEAKMFMEQELDHLHRTVDGMRSRSGTPLDAKLSKLTEGKGNIESELERLQKSIEALRSKTATPVPIDWNNEWYNECERLRDENEKVWTDYDRIKDENVGLIDDTDKLNTEVSDMKKEVKRLEQLVELNNEIQVENDRLKDETKELNERVRNLKMATDKQNSLIMLNTSLQEENNDLKSENRTMMVQLRDLEQNLEAALSMAEDQKERDAFMRDNKELRTEISNLRVILQKQETMLGEMNLQLEGDSQLRADYERLLKESEHMRNNMDMLNQSLQEQIEESMKLSEKTDNEADALQDEKKRLEEKNIHLTSEIEQLQAKLMGAPPPEAKTASATDAVGGKERLQSVSEENKKLRLEVQKLQRSFAKIELENQKEVDKVKDENRSLFRKVENDKSRLLKQLSAMSPVFKDCKNMEEILNKLDSQRLSLGVDETEGAAKLASPTVKRLETDIQKLMSENDQLKEEMVKYRTKLAQSGASPDQRSQLLTHQLQRQVAKLQQQLADADRRHREVVSTYRTHLLGAIQGEIDPEVSKALLHIVKLRETEEFC